MKDLFLASGWVLKSVVRMACLFGLFWLVIWGMNIGMFVIQVKGLLLNLLMAFCSGWFIDVISVIDWIITAAIAMLIVGLILFFIGRFVESLFFRMRPYTFKDIIPYVIVVLAVFVICDPRLHFIVPENLHGYLDMIRTEYGFSKMFWVPLEDGTYITYMALGTLAGSFFLIRSALNYFD